MRPRTAVVPVLRCADSHGPAARVGARHGGCHGCGRELLPPLNCSRAAPAVCPYPGHEAAAAQCCRWGVLLLASPVRWCLPLGRRTGPTGRHCVRSSCCSSRLVSRDHCWTRRSRRLRASRGGQCGRWSSSTVHQHQANTKSGKAARGSTGKTRRRRRKG